MKLHITYKQLQFLREQFDTQSDVDGDNIVKSYEDNEHYKWFDYIDPKFKGMIPPDQLEFSLKKGVEYLKNMFNYDLKRIVVKDKGEVVAFLIYSYTTGKREGLNDETPYPVLLSTAVHPDYRQRGLLKKMIESAGIQKPYLVQTSIISTPLVWEKMGCKVVAHRPPVGQVEKCNE